MNNLGILIMAALVVPATCVGMVWFVFRARQVAARANDMLECMNDDDLGAFRAQLAADAAAEAEAIRNRERFKHAHTHDPFIPGTFFTGDGANRWHYNDDD